MKEIVIVVLLFIGCSNAKPAKRCSLTCSGKKTLSSMNLFIDFTYISLLNLGGVVEHFLKVFRTSYRERRLGWVYLWCVHVKRPVLKGFFKAVSVCHLLKHVFINTRTSSMDEWVSESVPCKTDIPFFFRARREGSPARNHSIFYRACANYVSIGSCAVFGQNCMRKLLNLFVYVPS